MLGQRYHQKPSDRWIDREERDAGFNIMSPAGRRPVKGIRLPTKKLNSINTEGSPMSFANTIASNSSRRDEKENALFGVHAPQSMDGVSYIYTKGPAGLTPFPTLIAMSGYFPPSQQCQGQPQPQSQPQWAYGNPYTIPHHSTTQQTQTQPQTTPVVYPGPQQIPPPMYPPPQEAEEHEREQGMNVKDPEFWKHAYPRPTVETLPYPYPASAPPRPQ